MSMQSSGDLAKGFIIVYCWHAGTQYYSGLLTQKFPRAFDADRDDRLSFKEWQVGFYLLILLPKVGNHNHDVHDVSVSWSWSDKWLPPMCDWQAKAKQSAGSRHERSQQGGFLACYGGLNVKYRMVFCIHVILLLAPALERCSWSCSQTKVKSIQFYPGRR